MTGSNAMDTILVIEDKESMRAMLKQTLEAEGYQVITAHDGAEGIKRLADERIGLVLTDLKLPKKDGFEVIKAAKQENPLLPVIVMTAYGTIETAVKAVKEGAYDFLTKPFDTGHLLVLILRALNTTRVAAENILLRSEFADKLGAPKIIGKSRPLQEITASIQKAAPTNATVLIHGESGTGKELFARAIHYLSNRKDGPFIAINSAAIPRELLESELFGYERGAFTGAEARKLGKFELADKGTVFLDEIGDMDLALQAKILRVIQEQVIERVGGDKPIKIDVRIVAATNKNIEQAVQAKQFREDLFYRLNVFPITIPPLRERRDDIPPLAQHFLNKFSAEVRKGPITIADEAMDILMKSPWKGNIRELENVIERAVIYAEGGVVRSQDLGISEASIISALAEHVPMDGPLQEVAAAATRIAESRRIRQVLKQTGGNKTRAAEVLQVSYKTLLTKIKDYQLEAD
ncbi:MAG: two component, sigma54 specific, transcriptional regulator, Fis family [Nitrospirae bacterium]|nr:two component, sigma54 specific, transcriptional regulator, Fis family [Nitrospirota bacterium]